MIERDEDGFLCVTCDGCSSDYTSELYPDTYSRKDQAAQFLQFIDDIRAEGWICVKEDGTWLHYCPACREE
ncbi:MAG: hypothetical protein ABIJ57_05615 [Pseudomonadota bacterium]